MTRFWIAARIMNHKFEDNEVIVLDEDLFDFCIPHKTAEELIAWIDCNFNNGDSVPEDCRYFYCELIDSDDLMSVIYNGVTGAGKFSSGVKAKVLKSFAPNA